MIDQHEKTDLLIARLKESLPIEANITPPLAKLQAEQSPDIPVPATCKVTSIFYMFDVGGIICGLDIGGPNTDTPHLVSITHPPFQRRVPLSRDIESTNATGPKNSDSRMTSAIDHLTSAPRGHAPKHDRHKVLPWPENIMAARNDPLPVVASFNHSLSIELGLET